MKPIHYLVTAALALSSPALLAHGGEDHAAKASNGGQVAVAGGSHFELVVVKDSQEAKENPLYVYVTDSAGKKLSTAGATGSVTLLAGKLKTTATLAPDGDNRMKGSAQYASAPGLKLVVSITLPGKAAEQARFVR
jgi:hypothetical protein